MPGPQSSRIHLWQPLSCTFSHSPLDACPAACAEVTTVLPITLLMICSTQATLGPAHWGVDPRFLHVPWPECHSHPPFRGHSKFVLLSPYHPGGPLRLPLGQLSGRFSDFAGASFSKRLADFPYYALRGKI